MCCILCVCIYVITLYCIYGMFLIDYGTPDLFKSLFEIIHKSALEQVTGYQRYRNTLLLLLLLRNAFSGVICLSPYFIQIVYYYKFFFLTVQIRYKSSASY